MLNIHWSESITNGILYELTNQRPLSETIQQRQLRFIGHSLRRSPNELINQYALYTPKENNGKRRIGRPATIYAKYIDKTGDQSRNMDQDCCRLQIRSRMMMMMRCKVSKFKRQIQTCIRCKFLFVRRFKSCSPLM